MPQTTFNPSATALWASAFVIAALVILQAGRLPENAAYAEMASKFLDHFVRNHGAWCRRGETGRGQIPGLTTGIFEKPAERRGVATCREDLLRVAKLELRQRGSAFEKGLRFVKQTSDNDLGHSF